MAVKDHSLDHKIICAARDEFLAHGFLQASLHRIAEYAGVTTGALYTRYKGKDALFASLLEGVFAVFSQRFQPAAQRYAEAAESGDAADFLSAMEFESQIYMDVLFEHYDACVLLFCKSGGSSVEENLQALIRHKVNSTVEFLEKTAKRPVDREAVALLMEANFHIYRQLLESGQGKEEALACMKDVWIFLHAGWEALYKSLHNG